MARSVKDDEAGETRRRRRGQTRLSSKNQATIPVDAVRAAGLKPGDELRVTVEGAGKVTLTRATDWIEELAGCLSGVFAPDHLEKVRSEWDE